MIVRIPRAGIVAMLLCLGATAAAGQSREQVDRLATLGRVWGFLKYFHPAVAAGSVHWDSVLVATVRVVQAARTTAEFRAGLTSLVDAAGPVRACPSCLPAAPDSLRRNADMRWLTDSTTLGPDLVRRLVNVRDNRHQGSGRYVYFGNTAMFDRDTAYTTPDYPGEGQRMLALFRFWNAARYYFPYMYVNGGDWNTVLTEFIPRVAASTTAAEYHLAILEMTTRLHDAHVNAGSDVIIATLGGRYPAIEMRWIDSQVVVWKPAPGMSTDASGLQAGDVITHVDGQPVAQLRRDRAKYVAAGNPAVLERKLVQTAMRAGTDSVTYTIHRAGQSLSRRVAMPPRPVGPATRPTFPVSDLARVLPGNIGYINMGDINVNQVDSAIAIVRQATGIVMDVRNYPRGTMYRFAEFFNPAARPFVKFTAVDSTYPGQVVWTPPYFAGAQRGNADHYTGRVAILVDERTQSHAEFSVMALRTSPENRVIGSQTAGADGNITTVPLPGGLRAIFTGLGVYYPDGTPTQRIGIVPDIVVRPTLAGFRAGRDEVLERALEFIRTGR